MVRYKYLLGLAMVFSVGTVFADVIPMIDRHIFLPDASTDQKEEPPAVPVVTGSALEKEVMFSGVVVTPKGKLAMISEKSKNEKNKQKKVYKEGDQIKGMTVKEIGSNYVLIATKENTVKLNLYRGEKPRPAPMPEPAPAEVLNPLKTGMTADAANPQGTAPNAPGTPQKAGEAPAPQPGPFGGAKNRKAADSESGNGAQQPPPATNPFAEILKGATNNRSGRANPPLELPLNLPAAN